MRSIYEKNELQRVVRKGTIKPFEYITVSAGFLMMSLVVESVWLEDRTEMVSVKPNWFTDLGYLMPNSMPLP